MWARLYWFKKILHYIPFLLPGFVEKEKIIVVENAVFLTGIYFVEFETNFFLFWFKAKA